MDINSIVAELKKERDRLDRAISALDGEARTNGVTRTVGRPVARKRTTGSRLTPAGRKRLSEMMKKRWAERRKKAA
ncbi:MAG TPA: hypothetical protein VG322_09645 [Candidatus Acidoferrales bacterium]|jgi:hypothetical protein|nr:hypothetical protein [Candidatus Acidoferrales bacterium]